MKYSRLFWIYLKKHGKKNDNTSIGMNVNKIENRITVKNRTRYYIELFIHETIKLIGSTKNEINKNENCKNVPHLQATEVLLVHYNIINNDFYQDSKVLYTFVSSLVNYKIFYPKTLYF